MRNSEPYDNNYIYATVSVSLRNYLNNYLRKFVANKMVQLKN